MKPQDIVIHTTGPLSAAQIHELASLGLRITSTLALDRYRLRGELGAEPAALKAKAYITAVEEYSPDQKIDSALTMAAAAAARGAGAAPVMIRTVIELDPASSPRDTVAQIARMGAVIQSSDRRVLAEIPSNRIAEAAALHGVLALEPEPQNRAHNNVGRNLSHVDTVTADLGLDGSGEVVGVADTGLDNGLNDATLLADFRFRVINIRSTVDKGAFGVADGADLNNHGTHVCGTLLGNGANSNGNLHGAAPAAQLTMLSMGPNNGLGLSVPIQIDTGVFQDAFNDGARIHSNSWGANTHGNYNSQSSDVDEFMWNHRDDLVIFSAGNDGPGASTVTPPGTAKNCLTIGAAESDRPLPDTVHLDPNPQDTDFNPVTPPVNFPISLALGDPADDPDQIAEFSSRGPTDDTGDSRIKPDLVAPGSWILSCRSSVSTADYGPDGIGYFAPISGWYANDADGVATHDEAVGEGLPGAPFFGTWNENTPDPPPGSGPACQQNYYYSSGTSMSTPIVAGATALLRQYLRQRRGVASPSGALLKAMLVNGARIPAGESATPDNDRGFGWLDLENTIRPAGTGQQSFTDEIQLAVATGDVRHIEVQLADPAQPFRVTMAYTDYHGKGVQNRLYLRVITPGGVTIDGDVTAFPNVSNNVQRVHIDTPAAGVYTIEVHGVSVTHGVAALAPDIRQDFALAVINGVGISPKPVDIVQVIDHSGSMGFYGYMEPAKERAKQLVDMLRITDRTGVVAFDHTVTTVSGLAPITGADTQQAIKLSINGVVPAGTTSIGGGLEAGQADIAAAGDPAHPQALVLLSDGHENTPPWVGEVAGSPPAWYAGPDLSEALPGIPASTRIYTVSLGIQSDQALLQAIAAARGGTFHAINTAADIGTLHEIYVHLQALTGDEEVIGAGTDSVGGIIRPTSPAGGKSADGSRIFGTVQRPAEDLEETKRLAFRGVDVHRVPIDETIESVVMMVSWHDLARPVALALVSPSGKTYAGGSLAVRNGVGSSYQFFRIERPEPGEWQLRVRAKEKSASPSVYTWGVYGTTPIQAAIALPRKVLGVKTVRAVLKFRAPARTIELRDVRGAAASPRAAIGDLLQKYDEAMQRVKLNFEPDGKTPIALYRLAAVDQQMVARGKRSIFETVDNVLRVSRGHRPEAYVDAQVPGLYQLRFLAAGVTERGFPFQRLTHTSLLT